MCIFTQSLGVIRQRIVAAESRFGRPPGSVMLLAASKTRPAEDIEELAKSGQRAFGESYAQEALGKIAALADLPLALEWHFIGPIQTNKTRAIAEHFHWVQSVDRLKVAQRLNAQRPEQLGPLNVCIQVNISGESTKAGVSVRGTRGLAQAVASLKRLRLRGLMTLPAPSQDLEAQRRPFRELRLILEDLNALGLRMDTLSMGMTQDLEAAVAEGATIVRVGTGIFGPRR